MSLGTVASVVGIAAGASTLLGGSGGGQGGSSSGSGYSGPPVYIPTGVSYADASWQQLMANIMSGNNDIQSSVPGVLDSSYKNLLGIDQTPLITAGNTAGAQYGQLAQQAQQAGQTIMGQAPAAYQGAGALDAAGNMILNTAFDPQLALQKQQEQLVTDQTRSADSARGIAMGPQSVGNESQALSNFDINWQNNQLAREATGIGAANTAFQGGNASTMAGNTDLSGGLGVGAQAPGYTMAAAQAPIAGATAAYTAPATDATQFSSNMQGAVLSPAVGAQNQTIPYMNFGQGAQANAFNQQITANAQNQATSAAGMNSLLSGIKGLGSSSSPFSSWMNGLFGGGSTSTYGGSGGGVGTTSDYANLGGEDSGAGFSA